MGAPSKRRNARYTPLPVDGPLPIDMVRAVPAIRRDPLAYLGRVTARYGDLVAFPLPRTPVLLVNDPGAALRVLQDNHRNYDKATVQYRSLAMVTGAGLLTSDGEAWLRRRRQAQPGFHPAGLPSVAVAAVAAAHRMRAAWDAMPDGTPLDADAAAMHATLRVVGQVLFDVDVDTDLAGAAEAVIAAVAKALHLVVARARSPLAVGLLSSLPTPSRRRMTRANATLDAVCYDLIRRRRQVGEHGDDVFGLLLRAGLSDAELRDELVTLVIAGHETVASALTWTLHLLAGAAAVQDRLHEELDSVLGRRDPAWADLPALPYTRAVVDEALRLYPPAWVLTRRALDRDTLAGVEIPAGTLVLVSPWLLHRRAAAWPDPERFEPARFLGRGTGSLARRAGYLPFGAGPRLCSGRDLALVETVCILATLLRDRCIVVPPGHGEPRVDALVTLRPRGGLPLLLNHR